MALMNARRVDENNLRRRGRADAAHPVARRLRLGGYDRNLFAENLIQQGRLADVRPTDDRNVTGAKRRLCFFLVLVFLVCHKRKIVGSCIMTPWFRGSRSPLTRIFSL